MANCGVFIGYRQLKEGATSLKKNDLKALWREMSRNKAKYGNPGGAPFANAFYEVARCYPLASWRKAGREIAYQMLMWVEDIDKGISENLDCSSFDEIDWGELFMMHPLLLGHPQCPEDIHPLDVLYCINSDVRSLSYVDVDKFVSELLPEYAAEYTWSHKDVDAAREMGAGAFADWLERYAFSRKEDFPDNEKNAVDRCRGSLV